MNESQIQIAVADIIRDVLDQPTLELGRDTTADQVEGWDSLNHINIVVAAEQKFGIKFKTAEIETLRNFGELVDLIAQKIRLKG
jgi:acyl carrier protein